MERYTLQNSSLPLNRDYDVIVCGGGPAGVTAAIAAAREGAKTLLLESTGMLGGMATAGMVNAWTAGWDGFRHIHGGLSGRIIEEIRQHTRAATTPQQKWMPVEYEWLKLLLDKMVTESGADVLFYSHVCGVEMDDDRNIGVILVASKAGLTAYKAKVFVDCTGDADLCAWAGAGYSKGNEEGDLQAASLCFAVSGINDEAFAVMNDPYYDGTGIKRRALLRHIMRDGKYEIKSSHWVPRQMADGIWSFNAGHIYGVDPAKPETMTAGTMEGRRYARAYFEAFREYAPETFGNAYLMATAPTLGIRESRIIQGDYTFTVEDYLARRSFPDEVFRGSYFIDVHQEKRGATHRTDLQYEHYKDGESYGVPYRCLCPRDLDNVLVAGRTISSERLANGSLRVMSCCMNSGEAAGLAAKLAADMEAVNIHKVDTDHLRRRLKEEGAYLP